MRTDSATLRSINHGARDAEIRDSFAKLNSERWRAWWRSDPQMNPDGWRESQPK